MSSIKNILLIDDDKRLCQLLRDFLSHHQLNIKVTHSGENAIALIKENRLGLECYYDLLILDIMLPGISGLTTLKEIRKDNSIPIIMLTASGEEKDRILGLELGADDYLPKPFSTPELLARIKAILRRSSRYIKQDHISYGLIEVSAKARQVKYNNLDLALTGTEFEILYCLAINQGNTVNKDELSEHALGRSFVPYDRSIDTHISNIRTKLKKLGAIKDIIYSQRGVGYALIGDQ
ncbi:MAG: DNA-binding response OmpR family regulator [Woeseiaceae bacterium]|mgnify:FL=1|jgi:DNA-binding response OmpR family regulator|tara:strand:+ start:789 stop:1496 length:708 start_codon:yes stop_codon:yes gene_type:complete